MECVASVPEAYNSSQIIVLGLGFRGLAGILIGTGLDAIRLASRTRGSVESPSGLPGQRPVDPLLVATNEEQSTPSQCRNPFRFPRSTAVREALRITKDIPGKTSLKCVLAQAINCKLRLRTLKPKWLCFDNQQAESPHPAVLIDVHGGSV